MNSQIEESNGNEHFVLFECSRVQLLSHREEEVSVEVANVADDRFRVFEETEFEDVVSTRSRWIGDDLDDFKDVDLRVLAESAMSRETSEE